MRASASDSGAFLIRVLESRLHWATRILPL